jgi:mxaJ protein
MKGAALLSLLLLAGCSAVASPQPLRVCADPNNMPFSNQRKEGFENKLAALVAADLGRPVDYVWWAQRRGNVRETLNAGRCDLIPGIASGLEMLATTSPYYASTYVAVTREGVPPVASFDDPRLRNMKIAVQMIGDDFSNTPPAHALTRRGIVQNVRGFMIYGDYADANPQAPIVDAVARGEVDVAFVWGPVAGWFAGQRGLHVEPVRSGPDERLAFAIAMGTRKSDEALRGQVQRVLDRRKDDIARLLGEYRVPAVPLDAVPRPPDDDDD